MPLISDDKRLRTIIMKLPAAGRAKITNIDRVESERIAKSRARADHLSALENQARDLRVMIARLEEDKATFGSQWTKAYEADLIDRKAELAEKKKEIAAVRSVQDEAPKPPKDVRRRNDFLRDWVPDFGDVETFLQRQSPFARFKSAPAVVKRVERDVLPKLMDESLAKQGALIDEIRALENAALDVTTILDAAMDEIDRMGVPGKPDFGGLTKWTLFSERNIERRQGKMRWPMGAESNFGLTHATTGQLGISFVCWLLRDRVREMFEQEIRALVGDGGPSIAERTEKIAALQAKLLNEQRTFERLACCAEDGGLTVDRPVMHPLARLEIERVEDAPRPKEEPKHYPHVDQIGVGTIGQPIPAEVAGKWHVPKR